MSDDYTIVKVNIGVDKIINDYEAKEYITFKMLNGIKNYIIPFGMGMFKNFEDAMEKVNKAEREYKLKGIPVEKYENIK